MKTIFLKKEITRYIPIHTRLYYNDHPSHPRHFPGPNLLHYEFLFLHLLKRVNQIGTLQCLVATNEGGGGGM